MEDLRTKCGKGRAAYKPEWSPEKPWSLYWKGEAMLCVTSRHQAEQYFRAKGAYLPKEVAP